MRLFRFVRVHAFDGQTDGQTDVDSKVRSNKVRCTQKNGPVFWYHPVFRMSSPRNPAKVHVGFEFDRWVLWAQVLWDITIACGPGGCDVKPKSNDIVDESRASVRSVHDEIALRCPLARGHSRHI